jgi:hypothetical protein
MTFIFDAVGYAKPLRDRVWCKIRQKLTPTAGREFISEFIIGRIGDPRRHTRTEEMRVALELLETRISVEVGITAVSVVTHCAEELYFWRSRGGTA